MGLFASGVLLAALSVLLNLATIRVAGRHRWGGDTASGVQHFHTHWVCRLGGVPIFLAFALWLAVAGHGWDLGAPGAPQGLAGAPHVRWGLWMACLLPAFAVGLSEDLTGRVGPWARLLVTMTGAALAWLWLDVRVVRLGPDAVDAFLAATPAASFLVTLLFVGGATHALNIVDGYNGLASSYVLLTLAAVLVVALRVDDARIAQVAAGALAVTAGFFVLNFPFGRIFLGDAGAYLLGSLDAFLLAALVYRNPEVSPWFAALVLGYPVWETIFSMYRKIAVRRGSAMRPDGLHLHMLIYKRLVRTTQRGLAERQKLLMNAATTLYTTLLCLSATVPALLFWDNTHALFAFSAVFIATYLVLYLALVRFRLPRGARLRRIAGYEVATRADLGSEAQFSAK